MDKNQALAICEKYLPVWLRFKKDSTTKENSPAMWNELNTVHRFALGQFADMGCNDCIVGMFKKVFLWYEREIATQPKPVIEEPKEEAKPVDPTKNVQMTFPETPKQVDLSTKTYTELMDIAKSIKIYNTFTKETTKLVIEKNISKANLIKLIKDSNVSNISI
jgi:hypothetical protein